MYILIIALIVWAIVSVILLLIIGGKQKSGAAAEADAMRAEIARLSMGVDAARRDILEAQRQGTQELRTEQANESARQRSETGEQLTGLRRETGETLTGLRSELGQKLAEQALQHENKLENIRATMEQRIGALQQDNAKQLERMRETVDEKLQKTLEDRIGQSFKLVSERLEQVYKGLGEMQSLASGVGDLQKVLSNVKTRGILGEIQLSAILAEILPREQYEENIVTKPGSTERVEFAIRLPGEGGEGSQPVYLPIDAKFPTDAYQQLLDAYESGRQEVVDAAAKQLDSRIKQFAKTIHEKYVAPPATTEFAILFLPVEGLYAEVVRRGLVEDLQRQYKINIAGPTTMAALLNALQMGFKTLAIQKRSGEVWNVLSGVKAEFEKFEVVLKKAQQRLQQTDQELDKLIGVRTTAINRRLRGVSSLAEAQGGEGMPEDVVSGDEPDFAALDSESDTSSYNNEPYLLIGEEEARAEDETETLDPDA